MSDNILVEVKELTREYGDIRAVDSVNFELGAGDILGFLGPNGAGKSTTMQMISGNLAPTSGQVRIHGYDIIDQPREVKQHIGYLPEQPPIHKDLRVEEYLRFCAGLHKIKGGAIDTAIDEAVDRCGIDDVRQRLIGNLSKGYQQRVGIAQAIIHKPSVIILDEPTVGLDPIQIRAIRSLISDLGQEHGVILSTHILPEVLTVCNRVQIIHEGKLVFSEDMATLEQHMTTSCFEVRFSRPPQADDISRLDGIDRVVENKNGLFEVYFDDDASSELISKASAKNNWGLTQLVPRTRTLENIFVDVAYHDEQQSI